MGANGGSGFVPPGGTGGGGGITELLLGRTNYVSSAGSAGGQYQHLENQFNSINDAISNLSLDADLVVVLPGTYVITTANFQPTTNIFLYPGADVTFDNALTDSDLVNLNIDGFGDLFFEDLNRTMLASLTDVRIRCRSCDFAQANIDFAQCNISIEAIEDIVNASGFTFTSGAAYDRFVLTANVIELGVLTHVGSWTSVHLNSRLNLIKGRIDIDNSAALLFNFVVNGDLEHLIDLTTPALTITGNVLFNTLTNFDGFQMNGTIRTNTNVSAMLVAGGSRVQFNGGIKHNIDDEVTFPDVPAIFLSDGANSLVLIQPQSQYSICSFNSDGTRGVVFANNGGVTHTIIASGKFLNLGLNGEVFVAITATQELIFGAIMSNIVLDGANTNIQSQGASNQDPDIL